MVLNETFVRVMNFGSYMLLLMIIFVAIMSLTQQPTEKESFFDVATSVCPKIPRINSLQIDLRADSQLSEYEIPLSEFTELVLTNNIVKKSDFLKQLNKLQEVIDTTSKDHENDGQFYKVFEAGDDVLIHRNGKLFGFHIQFAQNPERAIPVGIVTHWEILTFYQKKKPEEIVLEEEEE